MLFDMIAKKRRSDDAISPISCRVQKSIAAKARSHKGNGMSVGMTSARGRRRLRR
jgi:hypothetical protein